MENLDIIRYFLDGELISSEEAEEYVKEALDNYKEYGGLGHFIEEMSHIKVQMIIFM